MNFSPVNIEHLDNGICAVHQHRSVKVVFLGDGNVGKTCIINRFANGVFQQVENTVAAAFRSKLYFYEGKSFQFQIWDTAGQEQFRSLAPLYYRDSAAAVLVYDVTFRDSFDSISYWVKELEDHGPKNVLMIVIANKIDCPVLREVPTEQGRHFSEANKLLFLETSALTGENIEEVFTLIAKNLPSLGPSLTRNLKIGPRTPDKPQKHKIKCCHV